MSYISIPESERITKTPLRPIILLRKRSPQRFSHALKMLYESDTHAIEPVGKASINKKHK